MAAARAIAGVIADDELDEECIIPTVFNDRIVPEVSRAVKEAALATGVARLKG
jgi:malate dehydrogenase (oxaloacetate-decarboxylating)